MDAGYSLLVQSIEPSQYEIIYGTTTPRQIWCSLKWSFRSKNPQSALLLTQEFRILRMAESENIVQHLERMLELARRLSDASGNEATDIDFMTTVCCFIIHFVKFRNTVEVMMQIDTPIPKKELITKLRAADQGANMISSAATDGNEHKRRYRHHRNAARNNLNCKDTDARESAGCAIVSGNRGWFN